MASKTLVAQRPVYLNNFMAAIYFEIWSHLLDMDNVRSGLSVFPIRVEATQADPLPASIMRPRCSHRRNNRLFLRRCCCGERRAAKFCSEGFVQATGS